MRLHLTVTYVSRVTGKIVLVDINQRDDWWITYPMLEAQHQGAAAILAANVGGFAQVADDALNSQDICGPTAIPTCSIGVADSQKIREKLENGPVVGTLIVDNEVEIGTGVTYNIMGKIRGKSSDYQILVGGHYDMHFFGFQDDNCAVGLVLAMAKAMKDSGYQPENDIVFCLHGAEEWGASYSQFDWTVGAWEMINHVHPEWVGKTLAFINFELPAYEFDTYTTTYSAPEMFAMLDYFANDYAYSPEPEGCFADGVLTEGYQTYTYSDDLSYYAAGVPSTVNGFLLQKDMETVFPFYIDYYHTQYDTPDTYNEAVMRFNIAYYGALAMYIDQMPAADLDFTAQTARLTAAMDKDVMAQAGADVIFGTHPNVAQGVERLQTVRSDGLTYETVVCYSLGCLLTDARDSENTAGMAVRLEMTYDPATRRASPGTLEIVPLYIARQREDSGIVYRVVDAENEQAIQSLTTTEQAAAAQAVERVKNATQEE